jgi:hypothetical protein
VSRIRYLIAQAKLRIWLNPDAGLRLMTAMAVALAVLAILLLSGSIH